MRHAPKVVLLIVAASTLSLFQNCSGVGISVQETTSEQGQEVIGDLGVCSGISCELTPLTSKPAVTTILLALGDQANDQLVVNGYSSQLIAETVVRYTSPKVNPKILVIRDSNSSKEDPEDTAYVVDELLVRYDVTFMEEPETGLNDEDLQDFDIVWLNNPGHSMGSVNTRDVLLRFQGGVILQGDDLTQGKGFSLDSLTGLKHLDNGVLVKCGDNTSYPHDNNDDYQFRVELDATKIAGLSNTTMEFRYGNDIDNSTPIRDDLEILATAKGGPSSCTEDRPVIVRYMK